MNKHTNERKKLKTSEQMNKRTKRTHEQTNKQTNERKKLKTSEVEN
jgi:hypothetical protein